MSWLYPVSKIFIVDVDNNRTLPDVIEYTDSSTQNINYHDLLF